MAGKNRFKQAAPSINFDDPAVLTSIPPVVVDEKKDKKSVPEVEVEPVPAVEVEPVTVETPAVEEKPKKEKKPAKENLLAGIVEQKPVGKSYALYLDTDVVAALDKLAAQNNLSRSKALNALLRKVLMD